jgi:hypothetical protein
MPGNMSVPTLISIICNFCNKNFNICRSCFRGHAYCGDQCRTCARRKSHRESQKIYRSTEKGKKNHRESERERRKKQKIKKIQKTVDDATSTVSPAIVYYQSIKQTTPPEFVNIPFSPSPATMGKCDFCGVWGKIVTKFPPRGYGGQNSYHERRRL